MTFWHILWALTTGAGYTILITLSCTAAGLVIGMTAALLSRMEWRLLNLALSLFTYVFRSVPALVLLFLFFFGLPGMGIRLSPFLAMVLSLGLISGAYHAEIFRGAMQAVQQDELLAAEAMGMTRLQSLMYIVLPQTLRMSVPGMINEFTSVLKYSPFAYTVGIPEIMKEALSLAAVTLRGVEIYLAVGIIIYFFIYRAFLTLFMSLDKRYRVPGLTAEQ